MYYICKLHKLDGELVAVDVCDSETGLVELFVVSELEGKDIDGVHGDKITLSEHALGDKYLSKELIKRKLSDSLKVDCSNNIKITLVDIYYSCEEENKMEYIGESFSQLNIEVGLLVNVCTTNDIHLTLCTYLSSNDNSTFDDDYDILDTSPELVKLIWNTLENEESMEKVLYTYFKSIRRLIYMSKYTSFGFKINDIILDKCIGDADIELSFSDTYIYYEV